jgi:lysophospholipase L1-like esterase
VAAANGFAAPSAQAQSIQPPSSQAQQTPCNASIDLVKMAQPLPRLARKLAAHEAVTIVAVGSSSTAGAGASSGGASYPSQLEAQLSAHFPKSQIKVINRGVNGEEAAEMLKRFKDGVLAEKPDLVLWQIGTNSVLRSHLTNSYEGLVHDGISQLKAAGADVVLVDPQYAPNVITKPEIENMVALIGTTAKREGVDLFKRFVMMHSWHTDEKIPFETFVSPDGIHMNDWGYACFARTLSAAIVEAATRPINTVSVGSPVR